MAAGIEKVIDAGLCTGCGLCASGLAGVPARMELSARGYLRPVFERPLGAAGDARLSQACPAVALDLAPDPAARQHTHWGPLVGVRTGWSTDAEVRYRGSSGGGISGLLIHLLETGQADFVAQVGVADDDPLRNDRKISRTRAEVLAAAGSRYAPAAPLAGVDELFGTGERFVFVGKPCDAAAFRQYLRQHPQRQPQVVAVVSFMCAGVPSLTGTHEVLQALGTHAAEVVRFQYRGNGWPGFATAVTADGRTLSMDYNRSWGQILGRHLQLRCKLCPDGTGEFADIVCADAWHGRDGYPDFEERDGRSLVLTRTAIGEALVTRAQAAGALATEPLDIAQIAGMQPYQLTRKQVVLGRWLGAWLRTGVWPRFRGLGLGAALKAGGLMPALRNAWGTFKRTARHGNG